MSGRALLEDVPEKVRDKAMLEGEREYWANLADEAKMRHKEGRLNGSDEDQIDPI